MQFAGHIHNNLVHQERFYTTHQVYDTNHKLHQVLKLALEIVHQFTSGTRLSDVCSRAKLSFPEVDRISVNEQILSSIKIERKTAPYERAFELARLIILNYSPDINQGNNKMIALLFDMNELWEEYVLVQLRKLIHSNSAYSHLQVTGQTTRPFWGSNYLQPDIEIVDANTQKTYIIDTKWKRPGHSASVEDLRQVYAYARFWDADEVMLLYPGKSVYSRSENYRTDDYKSQKNESPLKLQHIGKMGFVSVLNPNGGGLDSEIGSKILKEMGLSVNR